MNVSTVSIKKNGRSSFTGSNLSLRHNNKNHLKSKEFLAGNDNIKYRRTKLTQIDVNSSNYAEIIRLTSLLDEAYAKIKDLTSENKKLLTNQRVQERALKNTNEMVGDYPKTIEKLMEDIRVLKAQNKKYVEKLVSIERAQSKKVAIQNSTDNNYELKEKNHILHEELEKMEKDIIKLRESYEILKKKVRSQGNNSYDKNKTTSLKYGINKNEYEKNSNDHDSIRRSRDTLNKKPARNEINKPKKALNSNEVHQVIKKQAERKQQPLKLKSNFNNHKENNSSNDRNIIKKSNPNINIKNNCNESEENYKEIYSDDFDVIEDEDQKFFIPSQEESLKPSTLYKPNLYYSANCSPEPEIKNDNDNLSINEVLNDGNYYSDKFEEISFIDEKIDTEIPSSETTKSEILNEKNNQELDNSPEIVEEKLEANKYENNNSASIFDDHYYEDFYNDYAEENIKLNDNILNIDEYISNDITNMYKSQEENMLDKNNNIDNKNNGNISYSNMDENDDDDSLSFNNYNVLDLLK
ncbi:hypothetical protein H8356DRAFT_1085957 [Neocallimastix lanati (nom. inval.)]|nr:hypothetical protein H8356DRAFT_1085957 [Neocallimastix sp. JGI-2020a]